jgi:alpha-beta hydrolase superfamily lysophospholipase
MKIEKINDNQIRCTLTMADLASRKINLGELAYGSEKARNLFRDMMTGIHYIQLPKNLGAMKKDLPVFFIAGKDDPVGSYGKGVEQAAAAFRNAGMTDVSLKLYPLCRHEILNELNKEEVYQDVLSWLESNFPETN